MVADSVDSEDATREIGILVRRLHDTQQRLEELTGGEVDAVVHPAGDAYLLHQAQEKLRQSETTQRTSAATQSSILNALPAHIALLDRTGVILSVNDAWRRFATANVLQGPEFAVGRNYLEVCEGARGACAEEAHAAAAGIHRVLRGDFGEFVIEYPCHSPSEQRWFRLMVTPVHEDRRAGAVVMHVDITERRAGEIALRESEERFRRQSEYLTKVLDSSLDAICTFDAEGRFVQVSAACEEIWGYTPQELLGTKYLEKVLPEDQPRTIQAAIDITAGHPTLSFENRYVCKDGTVTDIHWSARWSEVDQSLFCVARDHTARKRSEERIEEQAALIDEARDAIVVRDLEHRIAFWSKGAERLYGWSAEEALGKFFYQLLRMDRARFADAERTVRETGAWNGEVENTARDQTVLTLDARWTLLHDQHGEPRSILSITTDITERKKIELQFLRTQRMESIGTLAGGIAHDLNNCLGPIITALVLLEEKFLDPDSQELLAMLSSSALRGADMVRQVLSFARGVEGERKDLQLRHVIDDVEKIVNDTFPKDIEVRTSFASDLWTVAGDATQLHQVMLNLCVNARDAMPGGGRLIISAENVVLDEHFAECNSEARAGPYVLLHVEDSGTGMPPEILAKIFDPFFTTKDVGKGTGLGLSTSLGIVQRHDGFLRAYSERGNGSKFDVYLPVQAECSSVAPPEAKVQLPRGRGEMILVVEDETSVAEVTQRTLEAFGYRVLVAADGAEAIALYAVRGPEIAAVLTDMMMPVMDGLATIQVLRKLNARMPIIATSGLVANEYVAKLANLNVQHFLPKPYTAAALLKGLQLSLAGEP